VAAEGRLDAQHVGRAHPVLGGGARELRQRTFRMGSGNFGWDEVGFPVRVVPSMCL
jgi:hypothetical protein